MSTKLVIDVSVLDRVEKEKRSDSFREVHNGSKEEADQS